MTTWTRIDEERERQLWEEAQRLKQAVELGEWMTGWEPTVGEAIVEWWRRHPDLKDASDAELKACSKACQEGDAETAKRHAEEAAKLMKYERLIKTAKQPEVIELTQTFGSSSPTPEESKSVPIGGLFHALELIRGGKINGAECYSPHVEALGGQGTEWRIRKWGPNMLQIKHVNFLGQEGSGDYQNLDHPKFPQPLLETKNQLSWRAI